MRTQWSWTVGLGVATMLMSSSAMATWVPKIRNIRIREGNETSNPVYRTGGGYTLAVAVDGEVEPTSKIVVIVKHDDNDAVDTVESPGLLLAPGPLETTVRAEFFSGAPRGVTADLTLVDVEGAPLWQGRTSLNGGGSWNAFDGTCQEGRVCDFEVGAGQLHATATRGRFGFSVTMRGDGSAAVAGALLVTTDIGDSRVPVVSETPVDGSGLQRQRVFTRSVGFDGDPTGFTYRLEAALQDARGKTEEKLKAELTMVQLAPGDDGAPGPILAVSVNGFGTRTVATANTTKPGLL